MTVHFGIVCSKFDHQRYTIVTFKKLIPITAALVTAGVLSTQALAATPDTAANTANIAAANAATGSDHPSPAALKSAINAYEWAITHGKVQNPNLLTVVDFTLPSYEKRMWIINVKKDLVLLNTYVAQGKNSGPIYATHFSNQPGSLTSSPGLFTTGTEYDGEHGHSLRLNGLEAGINNNALSRDIVIHPASYVTSEFIKANGYAGRSWGCFAVSPRYAGKIISTLKDGSVLFAYASTEKGDSLVNHSLSSAGQAMYDNIMNIHENALQRFFHSL